MGGGSGGFADDIALDVVEGGALGKGDGGGAADDAVVADAQVGDAGLNAGHRFEIVGIDAGALADTGAFVVAFGRAVPPGGFFVPVFAGGESWVAVVAGEIGFAVDDVACFGVVHGAVAACGDHATAF